jgi:bacteriocin biosynthesis cyclodehydratase domain-containing protein
MLAKACVGLVGCPGELRNGIAIALGSIGIGQLTELPHPSTWGMQAQGEPPNVDLIVACEESPAFAFFEAVNRACLASGIRWLHVSISGTLAQLGPTVVPHQTACYTCLELRQRTHQPELEGYLAHRDQTSKLDGPRDEGSLAPLWSMLSGQVAVEVMRLLIGFTPPVTIGRFYEFSAVSPSAISHEVLRVPRCLHCGRRRTLAEAWDQDFMPICVAT